MITSTHDEARERFERDTANHELTILHDDGLYRHLRFQRPGTSFYWFDLITWPGCLVISGDMGAYHFSRIEDMFEFFEPSGARGGFEDKRWGINPGYWSEKLRGPGGQDSARSFSYEGFKAQVDEWFSEIRKALGPASTAALRGALDERVLKDESYGCEVDDERTAYRLLDEFEHDGIRFTDAWEWSLRDFDFAFLWNCWAIVWGIERYREGGMA
jgi:hypothetical protein